METYKDEIMCAKCKGACCKTMGCIYDSDQFRYEGNFFKGRFFETDKLKKILKEEKISIAGQPMTGFLGDEWTFVLYLKAMDEGADVIDILGKGGPCVQLTDKGCKLPWDKRPMFGKTVEPIEGEKCKQTASAYSFMYNWLLFHNELEKLIEEYTGIEADEYIKKRIKEDSLLLKTKAENKIELTTMEKIKFEWYSKVVSDKPYVDNKFALDWMNSCMGF